MPTATAGLSPFSTKVGGRQYLIFSILDKKQSAQRSFTANMLLNAK